MKPMQIVKVFCLAGLGLALGPRTALAGGEVPEQAVPAPLMSPAPAAGVLYNEYFCNSSVVRRTYVPGYTPHATSLFENPREYPAALCVIANPYHQYGGIDGWYFGAPGGIQSSVPEGSPALAYYRGELGITSRLAHGYPEGMRVVEQVIYPVANACRRGGFYIQGSETPIKVTYPAPHPAPSAAPFSSGKTLEK